MITAAAWGLGGYFEKKGLHAGNLPPQVGITLRTTVALVVLAAVSWPQLRLIPQAGGRALVYLVVGGGEVITVKTALGMVLTVGGIVLLTF